MTDAGSTSDPNTTSGAAGGGAGATIMKPFQPVKKLEDSGCGCRLAGAETGGSAASGSCLAALVLALCRRARRRVS